MDILYCLSSHGSVIMTLRVRQAGILGNNPAPGEPTGKKAIFRCYYHIPPLKDIVRGRSLYILIIMLCLMRYSASRQCMSYCFSNITQDNKGSGRYEIRGQSHTVTLLHRKNTIRIRGHTKSVQETTKMKRIQQESLTTKMKLYSNH